MADIEVNFNSRKNDILVQLQKQIGDSLDAIGATAEGYAKDDCPVDTGRLRNSITYATENFGGEAGYSDDLGNQFSDGAARGKPEKNTVYIGTNVEYAPQIEYRDMAHKTGKAHFLRDAVTKHSTEYKAIVKAALDR